MPIKFRGLSDEDIRRQCEYVQPVGNAYDTFEALDKEPGETRKENVRYYFPLSHYVINYTVAGSTLSNIYQFLGLTQNQAKKICNFTYVFDKETGEFIDANDAANEHNTNILMGGDYLHYRIEKLTLEEFRTYTLAVLNKKASNFSGVYKPRITHGSGDRKLFEGYYVSSRKDITDEGLQGLQLHLLGNGNSLASKMIALSNRGIDAVKSLLNICVTKHIVVIPSTLRPSRETREFTQRDPLMALYKDVFNANRTLSVMIMSEQNIRAVISEYRRLSNACDHLLHEVPSSNKNAKSISDKLTGKYGQVRGSNLGKRLDYSGRSVIIVNPFLSLRKIRIPKKTIPKLYKYHILKAQQGEKEAGRSSKTAVDLVKAKPSSVRREMLDIVENNDVLDVYATIGRQPTLHKGSISSFEVEITNGNALELSPLVCPGFNADFDGDTMWYTVPLSPEAMEEAQQLTFIVNNPFWAKDGKCAISPRQEIVYGLNMATRNWEAAKGNIYTTPMDAAEAYRRVTRNQLKVYDRVTDSETGKDTTAGRLAFKHCIYPIAKDSKLILEVQHIHVCPRCLLKKHSFASEEYCPNHPGTAMIDVFRYGTAKCTNCGKSVSLSKLGASGISREEADKAVDALIAEFKNEAANELSIYKFCEALEKFEGDRSTYEQLCGIIDTIDSLDPSMFAHQDMSRYSTEQELNDIITHNNMCDFISAYYGLSEEHRKGFTDDIVISNYGERTAKLIGIDGTTMFSANGTGFNCTKGLYNFQRNEVLMSILQRKVRDRSIDSNIERQRFNVDNAEACPNCGVVVSKNILTYVNRLLTKGKDTFVDCIDKMVKLGFKVAKYYAPSLNVLSNINFDSQFAEFHQSVADITEMYEYGFVEDERFAEEYGARLEKLNEAVSDNINAKTLGEANGFLKMVESGARGSKSNLVQIYGYKGRVTKSSTEAFNAVIESCYTKQLHPMEHFMAAYGARRGIMDRSLETANTGYISRQLWHATQAMVIQNCEDCGTHDGITIRRSMLNLFSLSKNEVDRRKEEDELLVKFITGRYDTDGNFINKKRAKELVKYADEVTIRSPITCKNPCCVKCYGRDMSTQDIVVKGTPVGIIAAEGIGETTSQLTMRTFQSGGVAKKGGIGSAFDSMTNYVELKHKSYLGDYEPTAWASGVVCRTRMSATHDEVTIVSPDYDGEFSASVHIDVPTKTFVNKGEGLFADAGDQYIPEIIQHGGIQHACTYLSLKLFNIFRSECEINLKHFEVLAASMMRAVVLDKKSSSLLTGCIYSYKELLDNGWTPSSDAVLYWNLYKIGDIPNKSPNAVANIDFEDLGEGLFNTLCYDRVEHFNDPIENLVFGKRPKVGKEINPNYIKERVNFRVSEDIL